jgi:hypothetical protein
LPVIEEAKQQEAVDLAAPVLQSKIIIPEGHYWKFYKQK